MDVAVLRRMKTSTLCAVLFLAATACATEGGSDSDDSKSDHVAPLGTYSADPNEAGRLDPDEIFLAELTLRDNGTFHALLAEPLRYYTCRLDHRDSRTECGWEHEGGYALEGGVLQLDSLGIGPGRQYIVTRLGDGRIELRNIETRKSEVLVVADTNFCAEPIECELQGEECSGSFTCEENSCACTP